NLSASQIAYINRIIRVYEMPNLASIPGHPIQMVIDRIVKSNFFKGFSHVDVPEVVGEFETFDLFNFPENHVARRVTDSYFINKSSDKRNSMLLRPHTSVMWYHFLVKQGGLDKLLKEGEVKALSWGKVYRVDELDKTHHECFHQIDGLRITEKNKEVITQDTLKEVLSNTIKALFGDNVEYRFNVDNFPYTIDSLEVEVMYNGARLEVLGAGIVHPTVLEKLGLDPTKYNGWAFGFGLDRLTMAFKNVPDIRIFWSNDKRITSQWGNFEAYKEVSNFPPVFKDISFIIPKDSFVRDYEEEKKSGELELLKESESDLFSLSAIIRDIAGDLVEEVKILDMYENDKKFGAQNKSVTVRITFRAIDRTLTNEEINLTYFKIRVELEKELGYVLR
nr:hypothetical protein [Candidatus Gracilibacteria bacterium]